MAQQNSATDVLEARLDKINAILLGTSSGSWSNGDRVDYQILIDRLKKLSNSTAAVEETIPHLKQCRQIVQLLEPYITASKSCLVRIHERIDEVLAVRADLLNSIGQLKEVELLKQRVVVDFDFDTAAIKSSLSRVEALLVPLVLEADEQSKEIDQLIDVYEAIIKVISSSFSRWDSELHEAESKL